MNKYHLRRQILIPLAAAIIVLLSVLALNNYYYQRRQVASDAMQRLRSAERLMTVQLQSDANMLGAVLDSIRGNNALKAALKAKDREALFRIAKPLNDRLSMSHGITHFSFVGPDRKNILRLCAPEKCGDRIDRHTTVMAEKTGKLSSGLELGRLGNLTLRAVEPWYEGAHLIGYLELGMEIQHTIRKLHEMAGVEISVFVDKARLKRVEWETGMKMLGRPYAWDRLESVVLAYQTSNLFSEKLAGNAFRGSGAHSPDGVEITCDGLRFRCALFPINDVAGSRVGTIAIMRDITALTRSLRQNMILLGAIFVLVGGGAFALCFVYAGRLESELETTSQEIERLAITDPLTGLYNRRGFITFAEQQLKITERTGVRFSLLFADLDDMKSINDNLGHVKGDQALIEVARVLREVFRKGDIIARIGGDEFAVLASGAPRDTADVLRSRLQGRIDMHNNLESRDYYLSMSFGIVCEESPSTIDDLMARADALMYEEKRGKRA